MPQIKCYHTSDPEVIARHLKDRETGKTFWRLYKRDPKDNKFAPFKKLEESEIKRCELCYKIILDKPNARFCSEYCGEEFFRRETIDAEENRWDMRY